MSELSDLINRGGLIDDFKIEKSQDEPPTQPIKLADCLIDRGFDDMKDWRIDQLKKEVVRLSEECEKKQHEILDKNDKINELQAELDKMCDYNNNLKRQASEKVDMSSYDNVEITKYLRQHQDDCITINQLQAALDVIVDRYANLRKIHGLS